jgi:hypothetical protein
MPFLGGICQLLICGKKKKKKDTGNHPMSFRSASSRTHVSQQALFRALALVALAILTLAVTFALALGLFLFLLGLRRALRKHRGRHDGHHDNKWNNYPHRILLLSKINRNGLDISLNGASVLLLPVFFKKRR